MCPAALPGSDRAAERGEFDSVEAVVGSAQREAQRGRQSQD